MPQSKESPLFEEAREIVAALDKRIAEAMEPPTWVLRARESENPDVRAQVQEWWHQQWEATESLRRHRNQIIIQAARLRELQNPIIILVEPTTT